MRSIPKKKTAIVISASQRTEDLVAAKRIDFMFKTSDGDSKRYFLQLLSNSITKANSENPERWSLKLNMWNIALHVGASECLTLSPLGVSLLIYRDLAPKGIQFEAMNYRLDSGCEMVTISLRSLSRVLPTLERAHQSAISIAAKWRRPKPLQRPHSTGLTSFLSEYLGYRVPDPSYCIPPTLHLLNGGYGNGDKGFLEEAATGDRRAKSWVVPKSARIGDDAVINMAKFGLFATAKIASAPRPRLDWKNRYGANLHSIKLIETPISLEAVQAQIPDLRWARYPRSITTPTPELAAQIRELVWPKLNADDSERLLGMESPEEIERLASLEAEPVSTPMQRLVNIRIRSAKVRREVLGRANGICEWCEQPAPFNCPDGTPFLETHHTIRRAVDGPDDCAHVIALCPNCHRRTDFGSDKDAFNEMLKARLAKLDGKELASGKSGAGMTDWVRSMERPLLNSKAYLGE